MSSYSFNDNKPIQVTIPAGSKISNVFDTGINTPKCIHIPSNFNGTLLNFNVSIDNSSSLKPAYRINGQLITLTATTKDAVYIMGTDDFFGVKNIQLVSDTTATEDTTFTIILYRVN